MSIETGQHKAGTTIPEQPGLSLIEVVVVVAIFSVLASFAVPRVAAVREATPAIAARALAAELRIAVDRTHAIWIAERQPRRLELGERAIELAFGYPDRATVPALVEEMDGFAYDDATGLFSRLDGASTMADCGVGYRPPRAPGEAPRISVFTDGC